MEPSKNIKFTYLRDKNRNPVACIAYLPAENGKIRFGVSTLHVEKDSWDRNEARLTSAGSLVLHAFCADENHRRAPLDNILLQIRALTTFPTRTRKGAKLLLKAREERKKNNPVDKDSFVPRSKDPNRSLVQNVK